MRKTECLIFVSLASLALCGCGSGGGSNGISANPLADGRAALNRAAQSGSAADTATLQSALALFQQALQKTPDSAEAHFGVALCLAGVAGNDLDGGPSPDELVNSSGGGSAGSAGTGIIPLPPGTTGLVPTLAPGAGPGGLGANPNLPPPPAIGEVPPAPPGHAVPIHPLPPKHRLALLWNLDSGLANPYALLNMLAPVGSLQYGLIPFYGYSQDTADVARRQKLLATLETVEQNLKAVEAVPDFATTLPDPNRQGQLVSVGLPEVFLFDAYVNSLRTEVALSLAYVRDPGNVHLLPPSLPPNGAGAAPQPAIFAAGAPVPSGGTVSSPIQPGAPFGALDKDHDGKLTADEYLPPSPYLTLRDPALLATAMQALQAVGDLEAKGIAGVLARPAGGAYLVPNTDEVRADLMEVRDHVLPLIVQAATGPVTIEVPRFAVPGVVTATGAVSAPRLGSDQGGVFSIQPQPVPGGPPSPAPPAFTTEKITVNLAAWFNKPPADLKAFAPVYTLDAQGLPDPTLTKYTDATFGGLYPNGVPSDLMF